MTTTPVTNGDKNKATQGTAPPKLGHAPPQNLTIIGLDTKDGEEHPLYDRRINIQLDADRTRSYAKYGVQKRVKVWYNEATHKMVLVDGRQRVRYARAVWDMQAKQGMPEDKRIAVPWERVEGSSNDLWALSRALNQHDKSGGVMHAFEVMKTLKMNGNDYKKAALAHGVSEQSIRNSERIATKLSPELLASAEAKELTMTAAVELTYVPTEDQKAIVEEIKAEGNEPTVENVKRKAKAKQGKQGASLRDKVDRVEIALRKFAGLDHVTEQAKDSLIDYVSKQLVGKSIGKLAEKDDTRKETKSKAAKK